MNESALVRRLASALSILLPVAVLTFVSLNLAIGLHSDDVRIIADAQKSSYSELWTSPFLDRFYRPVVVTVVRVSMDVFGTVAVPLRILQAALIIASIYTLVAIFRDRFTPLARYSTGLFLLASPLTFVSVSLFAVGIGDLVVGLMFLLSVRACFRNEGALDARTLVGLVGCSIAALLSKESGILVAAYCAYEALRRGHRVVSRSYVVLLVRI